MELYRVTFSRVGTVATLQEEEDRPAVGEDTATSTIATVDATSKVTTMLEKLMERVETLEKRQAASLPQRRRRQSLLDMPTTGPHSPELSAGKLRTPGARSRALEGLFNMAQILTNISPVAPVGGYKLSSTVNGVQKLFYWILEQQ